MADPPDQQVPKTTPDDDIIDRLSALPDCVLLHILSFFNTKDAAATSILSTRWRNLFVLLPDIDLSFCVDNDVSGRDGLFYDFINLANRVIRRGNKAPIRKIRLCVKFLVESHLLVLFEALLMSAAVGISSSNVQELEISVSINKTKRLLSMCIPPGFFTCKTLVSLELNLGVEWVVPSLVCLPNPKVLHLYKFRLASEDSIRRFLQGCPLLEQLTLFLEPFVYESGSEEVEVKVLDISSPSLKKLMLYWDEEIKFEFTIVVKSNNLDSLVCFLKGQHKVTIDAPNLTSLNIQGHVQEVNITQNLMCLDKAIVEADFLYYVTTESAISLHGQYAFKFISGLQNVKSLYLSENILKALYFSQRVLPTFKDLILLELRPFYCLDFRRICISKVLSSLFESSPNLEVLIFSEVSYDGHFYCRVNFIIFSFPCLVLYHFIWTGVQELLSEDEEFDSVFPEALPLTFVEHLKEVEIRSFKGEEHEFKLVEYFLKNGKSLKKMALVREALKSVSEACDRILSFKKCSEDCQIVLKKK